MTKKPSTAELLAMLRGIAGKNGETPEDGFHPTSWWAEEWGLCISKAREYITHGIKAGTWEHKTYMLKFTTGRRKVPHYKPVIKQP